MYVPTQEEVYSVKLFVEAESDTLRTTHGYLRRRNTSLKVWLREPGKDSFRKMALSRNVSMAELEVWQKSLSDHELWVHKMTGVEHRRVGICACKRLHSVYVVFERAADPFHLYLRQCTVKNGQSFFELYDPKTP